MKFRLFIFDIIISISVCVCVCVKGCSVLFPASVVVFVVIPFVVYWSGGGERRGVRKT